MKNNIINIKGNTPKIIFWAICFILFLPIIILPPTFQPADWSRTMLFRSALAILSSFLLYKFFYRNDLSINIPKWKLSDYLPFLLLSGFILMVVISTIFSQDPRFSFFSSPARASGSLNMLFYFLFVLILTIFIKDRDWQKLWNISFFVASIASFLAIIQSFNLLKSVFLSYEGGGVPSFLGNSTFLAIYMLFMAIWSFVLLLQKKTKNQKLLYGGLFCLFVLTVFLSGSRATYLALLASFLFFLFFYPANIKRIKILKIAGASLMIFVIAIVLIFNFFPQLAKKNYIFSRLENRLSIERVSKDLFGTRFAVWEIALKAIKDKPLLGLGPENFYIGFEKYYDPAVPSMQKLWWDRPHNIFLDIGANLGLIALFFYITFWLVLLLKLQKLKKKEGDRQKLLSIHGLQAVFIGYLLALFFNFDSFSTYLISFFFVGYSFYLLSSNKETVEIKNGQKIVNHKNKKFLAIVFAFVLLLFLFFWNIKPLYINESIKYAIGLSNTKNCNKAVTIIEKLNKNPGILVVYNALIYSDTIKKCPVTEKELEYAKKGLEYLKKASAIQPTWSRIWLFMGGLVDVLAAREENPDNKNKLLLEAKNYLNQALKISPKRQEILTEFEKNYLIAEDYRTMKKIANDCIAIDQSQGICYWYLGIAEIFTGDQQNGKPHIQEALQKGGFSPRYIQLGAAYISQKNYKDAAGAYHQLVAEYPENASYHAVMALLSREAGDYDRAIIEAQKVMELQPDNPEVLQFVSSLLSLDPSNPMVHSSMAYIYKLSGQEDKAKKELQISAALFLNLISKNPGNANYHFALAKVYKELGEFEKALKESGTALSMDPDLRDAIYEFVEGYIPGGKSWADEKRKLE